MRTLIAFSTLGVLALLVFANIGADSAAPSIDGTYVLDYRELPDGKQVRSPDVIGMFDLHNGHRNFNVSWQQDGKPISISSISKYNLSAGEFTEDNIYYMMNDGPSAKPPTYDTTPASGKSPVTITGDKIQFKLPLHGEPEVVFDKSGFTATRAGAFVDHWKKTD